MIYKAKDRRKGRNVLLCGDCIKDDPANEYVYAEWHDGPPTPIDYDDAVDMRDGRFPVCDSCTTEIER